MHEQWIPGALLRFFQAPETKLHYTVRSTPDLILASIWTTSQLGGGDVGEGERAFRGRTTPWLPTDYNGIT